MYSRYITQAFCQTQKQHETLYPMPRGLQLDRNDLLVIMIILLTMQEDRTTMLLAATFYLFL